MLAEAKIPDELKKLQQWVLWKYEERDGKQTKVPYSIGGGRADATKSDTWESYTGVCNMFKMANGRYNGIGFVFSQDDPYCGIDLDDCRSPETGEITTWAQDIINTLDSYVDVSPSGTGIKVWIKGKKNTSRCRTKFESGEIEIYDKDRYFTVTGNSISDLTVIQERQNELNSLCERAFSKPSNVTSDSVTMPASETISSPAAELAIAPPVLSDEEILRLANSADNGDKFKALWVGDTTGYTSHSEADAALACLLAFYSKDAAQIERLFSQSALVREKWTDREDYRQRVIDGALAQVAEGYTPPKTSEEREAEAVKAEETISAVREIKDKLSAEKISKRATTRAAFGFVSDADVREAIKGTPLAHIVEVLESQATPPLPIQITLPQAVSILGTVMTKDNEDDTKSGPNRLSLRIMTNCNHPLSMQTYVMLVAPSRTGKDIGGIVPRTMQHYRKAIGTGGSAEGILEALIEVGDGFLQLNEMQNFLDRARWESSAEPLLNRMFEVGSFNERMAKKSRTTWFAYPSIYGQIQPGILEAKASTRSIESGLFGRFLYGYYNEQVFRRPNAHALYLDKLLPTLDRAATLVGDVMVPPDYSAPLGEEAAKTLDSKIIPCAFTLANQYLPKFAVMLGQRLTLAVTAGTTPEDAATIQDIWRRAEIVTRWFVGNAVQAVGGIGMGDSSSSRERLVELQRMLKHSIQTIMSRTDRNKPTIPQIRCTSRKYPAIKTAELMEALSVLIESGEVEEIESSKGKYYVLAKSE